MTARPTYDELFQRATELEKKIQAIKKVAKAHKKSEGWLEAVFTANPDPVIIFDEKEHTRHLNPAFTRIFGWSMDELMGYVIPFIPKDQVAITDKKIKELYKNETPVRFESKRLTKNGKLLDVLIHAAVIKDAAGVSNGIVMNLTDISEKNRIEEQLRQSHKIESINTMTGGISLEFNNLLYIIYGNAELLSDNINPADKGSVNEILNSSRKGMDLIKQLQTFSHNSVSNSQSINLNSEIKRVYEVIRHSIPKMVEIKMELVDNLYTLEGNQGQIEQILINLCLNAGDAMPEAGKLTIKTENYIINDSFCASHPELQKGWFVKLTVSDTGHGMDRDVRKRIFDPFFTTKDPEKSPGLGMSVIYGIIKSHKGKILCGSIPGVGTTFTVYLPAKVDVDNSAPVPLANGKKQTILIVDDEQSVLDLIEKMVSVLGYHSITVNSAEKALIEYYRRKDRIDLILLDLGMPGMGGKICLKKLIEYDSDVKVVIASGYFGDTHVKSIIHDGAKDYIVKPFSRKDLQKVIENVLNKAKNNLVSA